MIFLAEFRRFFFIFASLVLSKQDGTLLKTRSRSAGQSVSFSNYSIRGLVMSREKNKPRFKKKPRF